MKCLDHKVKVLTHLQIGHLNWIEDSTVKADLAEAKRVIQEALKPGQVPEGSEEDNQGTLLIGLPWSASALVVYMKHTRPILCAR